MSWETVTCSYCLRPVHRRYAHWLTFTDRPKTLPVHVACNHEINKLLETPQPWPEQFQSWLDREDIRVFTKTFMVREETS